MRLIPTEANRPDWPRIVAQAVNALIRRTDYEALGDYADDEAAASGGVPVGGLYHSGGQVRIRQA